MRGRSSPTPRTPEALPETSREDDQEPPTVPETPFCADVGDFTSGGPTVPETPFCADAGDGTAAETSDELTFPAEEQPAMRRSQQARKAPDYLKDSTYLSSEFHIHRIGMRPGISLG